MCTLCASVMCALHVFACVCMCFHVRACMRSCIHAYVCARTHACVPMYFLLSAYLGPIPGGCCPGSAESVSSADSLLVSLANATIGVEFDSTNTKVTFYDAAVMITDEAGELRSVLFLLKETCWLSVL